MEATALKLPDWVEEDELVRVPATWDEYLDLLNEADQTNPTLTIQFLNNEVIMSQATDVHEELVSTISWLLKTTLRTQRNYRVLGSNVHIVVPGRKGDFNADVSVVNGPSDYGTTDKGELTKMRIKNPEIVVEILSKSTRKFDEGEKLAYYKLIPSLKYVLLIDQEKPFVSVYSRTENPDEWLNHDYWSLDSMVRLGEIELPMRDIYNDTLPESPKIN